VAGRPPHKPTMREEGGWCGGVVAPVRASFADAVRSDQVSHGVLPLLGTGLLPVCFPSALFATQRLGLAGSQSIC